MNFKESHRARDNHNRGCRADRGYRPRLAQAVGCWAVGCWAVVGYLVVGWSLAGCGSPAAPLPVDKPPPSGSPKSGAGGAGEASTSATAPKAAVVENANSTPATASNGEAGQAGKASSSSGAAQTQAAQAQSTQAQSAQTTQQLPPPRADEAGGKAWTHAITLPLEFWEGQYLNGQRIGVTHYKVEKADRERLQLEATTTMTILRGKQTIRQIVAVETIERANGIVDSFFETITDNNGTVSKQGGSITDERLLLRAATAGQANKTVTWPATSWGPLGIQQLLWRQPMTSGERRVAQVFLPQAHQLARITLVAGQIEDTTSPSGLLAKVLPIDVLMQLEKEGLAIRLWTDNSGNILKTAWLQGLNLSSYRISQTVAEQLEAQGTVDLLATTSIPVTLLQKSGGVTATNATSASGTTTALVDVAQAERVIYKVESSQADPVRLFSTQTNQTVGKSTTYQVELIVARPPVEGALTTKAAQTAPGPECLSSSAYIGSKDVRVAELAAQLAGDERQPAVVALKLTQGVHATIRKKNFSNMFDTAQDVARTLEGDCTEHAVLLAATLRSRQVPARIASGLVIAPSDKGAVFLYHMWTEAWLGDRWLPLDATTGKPTHCGYIKFLETALEGDNPYTALLPVLQSLGNLKISVQETSP